MKFGKFMAFGILGAALSAVTFFVTSALSADEPAPAKNVILMIGDGMGFNADLAGTYWRFGDADAQTHHQFPKHLGCSTFSITQRDFDPAKTKGYDPDVFWTDLSGAQKGTDSTSVTDSAASGTAINTGSKTLNGRIGMNFKAEPLKTFGQTAAEAGRSVGIVTTVGLPDATPGAVMGHFPSRNRWIGISSEMFLEQPTTVVIGCGHPEFNNGNKFDRPADQLEYRAVGGKYVWRALKKNDGFADALFIEDRADFDKIAAAFPGSGAKLPKRLIGVPKSGELPPIDGFDDAAGEKLFEGNFGGTDRDAVPTLSAMSVAALNVLAQNDKGFYLMIEGGAIDHANHGNDISQMVLHHASFAKAIDAVCGWVDQFSGWDETVIIITADHETGQIWGPNAYDDQNKDGNFNSGDVTNGFTPVVNRGKSRVPSVQYGTGGHTNSLVPVWIKGARAERIDDFVRGNDAKAGEIWKFSGDFIDNTDITPFMKAASGLEKEKK